jgi:uncharacterized membrane protein
MISSSMVASIVISLYLSTLMYRAAVSAGRRGRLWSLSAIFWISLLQLQFGVSVLICIIGFLSLFLPMVLTKPHRSINKSKYQNSSQHSQIPF